MTAYNSIDWCFLFDTIQILNFPEQFIHLIQQCVGSARYSVILNGSLEGFFPGGRGLRQGDTISPYLFLLFMEDFSALFQFRVGQGDFSFHPKCRPLNIINLAFGDVCLS